MSIQADIVTEKTKIIIGLPLAGFLMYQTLEYLWYKYIKKSETVAVKGREYHESKYFQSDAEIIPRWRAIKHGYEPCPLCFGAEMEHGKYEDTAGELDITT